MAGPYRGTVGGEVYRAPTRDGMATLQISPKRVVLEVGARKLMVTNHFVTVTHPFRRRPRSRGLKSARLYVARGVPVEDIGIWYQPRPGVVARIFGVRPPQLLDGAALAAWRALDRLVTALRGALAPYRGDTVWAAEYGHGADRVLVVDQGERYLVYVRRLFRELPRRALEVARDGTVVLVRSGWDQRISCTSRFAVTVLGDRILFANREGDVLGHIWLPWIGPEDRSELARRMGIRLHRPELDTSPGELTFLGQCSGVIA